MFFAFAQPQVLAQSVDIAGAIFAQNTDVLGSKLVLNGAGVRYKALFKVYAAALYLPNKMTTSEEVFASKGAKRIVLTMLRDVDSYEMGRLFARGVEANMSKPEYSRLIPGILRITDALSGHKKALTNESIIIDWSAQSGTVVTYKGVQQGDPIRELEFFNAMLKIWLGSSPVDWMLKDALLGKAPSK